MCAYHHAFSSREHPIHIMVIRLSWGCLMQVQQHHPALLHVQDQLADALADGQDARAALARAYADLQV